MYYSIIKIRHVRILLIIVLLWTPRQSPIFYSDNEENLERFPRKEFCFLSSENNIENLKGLQEFQTLNTCIYCLKSYGLGTIGDNGSIGSSGSVPIIESIQSSA